ncbi:thymidine kinase-like isoform X1 [Acyrthosiphon pisum]|uniref:ACYPI006294 protein n=1 Tax=Acyrthosiphon pisum TaxID=7029 RepID=C4WUU6_ACYPI|nr:thymidine kinase-like [Acyrthosiphon pisum]XP_016663276.1 thymidine kinase-like isoform X1 [Acyrthosiphon pisum]BAH71666.1 ACYPI006294 [Acyrthosiphon pisum]|eukprot:NP_001156207.1 thymidine kinase-like [Acyrthosiphon pisum]
MKKHIVKKPFRVAVEGNVGSGKSTLIKYFEKFKEVETNPEPIETWRDLNGHNLLQLTYSDPHRWNFAFQHNVQLSRLNLQSKTTNKDIQMFERSLQNNRYCFVEMAHDKGLLSSPEYGVMCQWYEYIETNVDIGLDLIVYLRSLPDIVHTRMQRRNRPEERTVKLDYLIDLHEYYEKWLMEKFFNLPCSLLVIDVNKDLSDNQLVDIYKTYENRILGKIPVL